MVSSFSLIPGVCIENMKNKKTYMIKRRTGETITLEDLSTSEESIEPISLIDLFHYKVVEVICENQ